MTRFALAVLAAWLGAIGVAFAQADHVYTIPEFTFENGEKLENMKVGYSPRARAACGRGRGRRS
jgi:hypothetical protein